MNMEVRRQERLYWTEEKDFKRAELLGTYMAKLLYRWNNGKFKNEYLKKLEKNWQKQKGEEKKIEKRSRVKATSSSRSRNLEGGIMSEIQSLDASFFI